MNPMPAPAAVAPAPAAHTHPATPAVASALVPFAPPAANPAACVPASPGANPGRSATITVRGATFVRIPIRTHILTSRDNIVEVVDHATVGCRQPGDVVFISEKAVAVTQGRAIPESEIRIGLTARLLWRTVRKVPYGIGLRSPSSFQCAVNECGAPRIWLAAAAGAVGKMLGRRGDFYRVAGMQAATIDAAHTSPLQPDCVILGPRDPNRVAAAVRGATGLECAIVDVNDIGGSWVLGCTGGVNKELVQDCLRDNPLGQTDEQTPFGLLRHLGGATERGSA